MLHAVLLGTLLCTIASVHQPITKPTMLTRAEWGAKPVGDGAREHRITRITVHHTGTAQNANRSLEDKLRGLQAWSQRDDKLSSGKEKPAWPDIPYHYYIDVSGRIGEGREPKWVGDTNTEYDPTGHLLIVVEGSFDTEVPTEAQLKSLREVTLWAASVWAVPADRVGGHSDFAVTGCPGDRIEAFLPELRRLVRVTLGD